MMIEVQNTKKAAALFAGQKETMILSCMQKVMGQVYADSVEAPETAMAFLGDFCFMAGKPNREFVRYIPEVRGKDFVIMVPQGEAWAGLMEECLGDSAKKVTRYAMKKEPDVFDREKLQRIVRTFQEGEFAACNGYTIKMMDEEWFHRCKAVEWCRDWTAQYPDYEAYQKYGLGVMIMKEGEPVAGASSYSGYFGGIEIEIDTKEEYRRRGLAYVCGAKLILECLERGWYPSWDAQNKGSAALAQKLGYHFDYEYTAYEVWGGRGTK